MHYMSFSSTFKAKILACLALISFFKGNPSQAENTRESELIQALIVLGIDPFEFDAKRIEQHSQNWNVNFGCVGNTVIH